MHSRMKPSAEAFEDAICSAEAFGMQLAVGLQGAKCLSMKPAHANGRPKQKGTHCSREAP